MSCRICRRRISCCTVPWAAAARFPCARTRRARPSAPPCFPWRSRSMSTSLLSEREGRLLRLTLNRPEKRNALNLELCQALADACDAADADPGVGAILLEANGKSFCSGMDLKEVLGVDSAAINTAHERLFSVGVRLNKPLVAAVQGAALAGVTGLVAACHVVVAAEDAQFGLTEVASASCRLLCCAASSRLSASAGPSNGALPAAFAAPGRPPNAAWCIRWFLAASCRRTRARSPQPSPPPAPLCSAAG